MEIAVFLLPTHFCSDQKTPIEYRLETRKCDRRTRFFKKYATAKCNARIFENMMKYCIKKGDRLISRNGKFAYQIHKWLLEEGWKA